MNIANSPELKLSFKGTIKIKGNKSLKTPLYKDDIVLSQMTNNLRQVGIDRHPGSVDSNGSLQIQPGLNVKHNKRANTITFSIGPADKPLAQYTIRKNEKGKTLPNMESHQSIFEEAIKYIDKITKVAKEKSNILAKVNTKSADKVYDAIHRHIY